MWEIVVGGRGILKVRILVVKMGINIDCFFFDFSKKFYVYDCFGIFRDCKIVVFFGYMEKRKGVYIILKVVEVLVYLKGW